MRGATLGLSPFRVARARGKNQSNRHIIIFLQGCSGEDYAYCRFVTPITAGKVLVCKGSGGPDLMVLTSSVGCFSALERSRLSSEAAMAGSTTALASRPPLLAS